ncbi:MAG TPA: DUF4231 domain-containing protein [Oceanobacillus sp.]|nr:DUF4231 domain-containing protein [Oceanobacillus sp.]
MERVRAVLQSVWNAIRRFFRGLGSVGAAIVAAVKPLLNWIWKMLLSLPIWLGLTHNSEKKKLFQEMITISPVASDKRQEYFLTHDWLGQLLDVDQRAHGYKSMYYILRFLAVAGAVVVTYLTLRDSSNRETAAIVSAIVAVSVGWEAAFGYGEKWQLFRRMSAELEATGRLFLQSLPPGGGAAPEQEYQAFVQTVQDILKQKVEGYTALVVRLMSRGNDGDSKPAAASSPPRPVTVPATPVTSEDAPPPPRARPAPKPRKQT